MAMINPTYFRLRGVLDAGGGNLDLGELVGVTGQVLEVGQQDPTHQHFVLVQYVY